MRWYLETGHTQVYKVEKYMRYIAHLAVNGHPAALGANPPALLDLPTRSIVPPDLAGIDAALAASVSSLEPQKWRKLLQAEGPTAFAKAVREHPGLLVMDTTWRDAHQSLLATRMRTDDLVKAAEATRRVIGSDAFSLEMWGGAAFDVSMRFLR